MTLKTRATKEKNYTSKAFVQQKHYQRNEKMTYRMGENTNHVSDMGVVSRVCNKLL